MTTLKQNKTKINIHVLPPIQVYVSFRYIYIFYCDTGYLIKSCLASLEICAVQELYQRHIGATTSQLDTLSRQKDKFPPKCFEPREHYHNTRITTHYVQNHCLNIHINSLICKKCQVHCDKSILLLWIHFFFSITEF